MGQFEGQILPSHLLLRNPLSLKLLSPFSSWTRKESPAQVEKKVTLYVFLQYGLLLKAITTTIFT